MRSWIVVQHVGFEGPGLIADVAAERGLDLDVRRMDLGDPLPEVDQLDAVGGLVVMGGPMGALEDAAHPHLAAERRLLAAAVAEGLPVLGVCLGAQLLAAALGGQVYRGPLEEAGLGIVELTASGRGDPVLGPAGRYLPVLHWHADTFTLPPGAVLLAGTTHYAHQAFRARGCAYGLQFHVEITPAALEQLDEHLPPNALRDPRHAALVARAGRALLQRFFTQAASGSRARPE